MRLMIGLVALALNLGPAAMAQSASAPLTYSASTKATDLELTGGGIIPIDRVNAGPADSIASVSIIYGMKILDIPGATISAGSKPHRLKTSLTDKELRKM